MFQVERVIHSLFFIDLHTLSKEKSLARPTRVVSDEDVDETRHCRSATLAYLRIVRNYFILPILLAFTWIYFINKVVGTSDRGWEYFYWWNW
jgi:hypothetical protein